MKIRAKACGQKAALPGRAGNGQQARRILSRRTLVGLMATMGINARSRHVFGPAERCGIRARHTGHRAALDGDPLHVATLRIIIVHRVVLDRAVVSHGNAATTAHSRTNPTVIVLTGSQLTRSYF